MKVLACIDHSRHAEDVLDHAAWVARRLSASVEVLHAIERPTAAPSADYSGRLVIDQREALLHQLADLDARRNRLAQESGRHLLDGASAFIRQHGIDDVRQRLVHGSIADHIRDYGDDTRVIVIGKQSEGDATHDLGMNLERVVRASTRPVLVTSGPLAPVEQVVLAFDGGETTGKAIAMLINRPELIDAPIHLVMVGGNDPRKAQQVADAASRLRSSGYTVTEEIIPGTPEDVIPEQVERIGANVLITGAYGHSRIRAMFVGSTTTALLRKSTVPMLVMR
jgi:nucleotide-binding universal stress UspA family protein